MTKHVASTPIDTVYREKSYGIDYSLDHSQERTKTEMIESSFNRAKLSAQNAFGELTEEGPGLYRWGPNQNGRTGKVWIYPLDKFSGKHVAD